MHLDMYKQKRCVSFHSNKNSWLIKISKQEIKSIVDSFYLVLDFISGHQATKGSLRSLSLWANG